MAAVGHNRATILEKGTTDAVLSPNAFARWDRPYAHYAIFAFDRSGNHSARIAGSDLSVTSKWLGSGELRVENGLIFQNQCSTSHPTLCGYNRAAGRRVEPRPDRAGGLCRAG